MLRKTDPERMATVLYVTAEVLRIVAILALIAAGFGWLTGRVNTGALVTVIIGIAIIFSAPWIVDQLQG